MLDYWCAHPWLRPFVEEGLLDFALHDAEGDRPLRLRETGEVLTPESVNNPLIVIANYYFDGIPQDAFRVRDGKLYELLLTLSSAQHEPDLTDPTLLSRLECAYTEKEIAGAYYDRPEWDRILDDYGRRLPDTSFSFPSDALRLVGQFRQLSGERLLLLTGDRGWCHEDDLAGQEEPRLARHGSFSMMVNYDAIARYCADQRGTSFLPVHQPGSLVVGAFLFGAPRGGVPETTRAWEEVLAWFNPDDFFALKKGLEKVHESLTLPQLLAYLRLSNWDPNIMAGIASTLMERLHEAPASLKQDVYQGIHRVWDHYFPIGEDADLAVVLGTLLQILDHYPEAMRFYQHSRALHGPKPLTLYSLAVCQHRLRQLEAAAQSVEEALALDPNFEAARALRSVVRLDLDRGLAAS
jgi:tetratricopeptide (TPR) repeat protein